jgi:hypothetical protein
MFFRPNETAICVCCVLWASEEEEFVRLVSPVFWLLGKYRKEDLVKKRSQRRRRRSDM